MALVPESIDEHESLDRDSYEAYGLEATQLSQPLPDQQASQFANSQVEPRRKYCECSFHLSPLAHSSVLLSQLTILRAS